MNSVRLHRHLVQALAAIGMGANQPQRTNLAGLSQVLAFSPNCHLATLALGLPFAGQRENLIQRLRRFLKSAGLQPLACYGPLVRHIFATWPDGEVTLVMDRTDLENRLSILTLGAAYRKRLLPLAWEVSGFGGSSAARQIALLKWVQPYLPCPPQVRVNFYADAEFRSVDVQAHCRTAGWHWQVGLKSDLHFRTPDAGWQPLRNLGLQRGDRCYRQEIYVNQQRPFGPVNLIADWAPAQDAPRYWALDLPADAHAWRRGRKRYWIEPTFRDWKSYGFDLEKSKLVDPGRLDVLLLGVALTTVWMIHVGEWLLHSGRRSELAPRDKADYSLFRLGRDYLQRARTLEQRIPIGFTVGPPA
ncbi:MAG: hypothetical protein CVU38_17020 [Chloroflexi bacterium HGW-Chloroflexi-1]|nr:MAG: hypothetical protein CVU38_17020 [Chloroflexi bacterium HGW-Chloroflexi-1]